MSFLKKAKSAFSRVARSKHNHDEGGQHPKTCRSCGTILDARSDQTPPSGDECHVRIVQEEDNMERLYRTQRAPRRVRTLRALRLIPSSVTTTVTVAELGIQTSISPPDGATDFLEYREGEMSPGVSMANGGTPSLKATLNEQERAKQVLSDKTEKLMSEIQDGYKDRLRLQRELETLNASEEDWVMKMAYLEDDKDYVQKNLDEMREALRKANRKLNKALKRNEKYKSLLLESRMNYSKSLSEHMEELNESLDENRTLIALKKKDSSGLLKKTFSLTEKCLRLEEQKGELLEQVDLLSSQSITQQLRMEDMEHNMGAMAKVVRAFEKTGVDPEGLEVCPSLQQLLDMCSTPDVDQYHRTLPEWKTNSENSMYDERSANISIVDNSMDFSIQCDLTSTSLMTSDSGSISSEYRNKPPTDKFDVSDAIYVEKCVGEDCLSTTLTPSSPTGGPAGGATLAGQGDMSPGEKVCYTQESLLQSSRSPRLPAACANGDKMCPN